MTTTDKSAQKSTRNPTQSDFVLPRRFLRPLLFLAFGRSERFYGYQLAEAVRQNGLAVDLAGVYRELRALEKSDLLWSEWEPSQNGPDRRVYMMTIAGEAAREEAIASIRQARDQLSSALDRASEA